MPSFVIVSSPRPWGCFCLAPLVVALEMVFPTPVGVFLNSSSRLSASSRLPHARGGVSSCSNSPSARRRSSPRPWGCFPLLAFLSKRLKVFPTPVGVFLPLSRAGPPPAGLPHARGGVSLAGCEANPPTRSSPRPWGCFSCRGSERPLSLVFPTPVGVFPSQLVLM